MSNAPHQQAAAEVRAAIARGGETHQKIADELGISRRTLTRKLAGERPFTVDEFVAIAAMTGSDAGAMITPLLATESEAA